jgi:CubicO group peptidase (beta-lactamase class C family)
MLEDGPAGSGSVPKAEGAHMIGRREFLGAAATGLVGAWTGRAGGQETKAAAKKGAEKTTRKALRPVMPAPLPLPKPDERVNRGLAEVRDKHKLPGMVGAVLRGDRLAAIGAVGVRKKGSEEPFRVDNLVHIGSDTKAMTATMLATLVEDGKLSWSSTVRDVFPARAKALHRDFQGVTLWQLLTHRAGLPANAAWWGLKGRTPTEQRRDLLAKAMSPAPRSKPGSTYLYSNVGYALAGLMAEQVADAPWEDLMRERVFEPLGMATAGFGPPGSPGQVDEPWGHSSGGTPRQGDNPPVLGPAGTVHVSLPDWARFAALHLRGAQGKAQLLEASTFRRLHTPPAGDYAAGWIVVDRPWAGGRALTHSGSNTMWHCTVWLAPARDFGVLVATNQGGDDAASACDEASEGLILTALGMTRRQ